MSLFNVSLDFLLLPFLLFFHETTDPNVPNIQPNACTLVVSGTNVQCNGAADGTATVTPSGGTAPYTYSWDNGGTTATITGLAPGTYKVTVMDAATCNETDSVTITEPSALSSSISSTNVQCNGDATGTATVTPSGGTSPYSYSWSTGATTASISSLSAATYLVVVTDNNGCTVTDSVAITEPTAFILATNSTAVDCNGASSGTASVTVGGATSPYTYSWSNGGTSSGITGLSAGSYTFTVTDANSCTISSNVNVTEPSAITITISGTDSICAGDSTASLTANVSGGTSPYTYSWNDGTTTATLDSVPVGTYQVTVTDQNSCNSSASFTVSTLAAESAAFSYVDTIFCTSDPNPVPSVTGNLGGQFFSTATININTGEIDIASLPSAGKFSVTYVTAGNCPDSSTIELTFEAPEDPTFTYGSTFSVFCQSDSNNANLIPTGTGVGKGSFTSTPSGILFKDSTNGEIQVQNSTAGIYIVTNTITGTACDIVTYTQIVEIAAVSNPDFSYSSSLFCQSSSDPLPVINGDLGGKFVSSSGLEIDSVSGLIDVSASQAGVYTVTYSVGNTCPASTDFSITIDSAASALFSYSGSPYCLNDPSTPGPTFSTGAIAGTFSANAGLSINNSSGIIDITGSTPATYLVTNTVTQSGCPTATASAFVTINDIDDATFSYDTSVYCMTGVAVPTFGVSTTLSGTFSSTSGLVFSSTSSGVIDLASSTAGTYDIIYTTPAGGCQSSDTFALAVSAIPTEPVITNPNICICANDGLTDDTVFVTSNTTDIRWYNSLPISSSNLLSVTNPTSPTLADLGLNSSSLTNQTRYVVSFDQTGCESDPDTFTLEVGSLPTVTLFASPTTSICKGGTVNFTAFGATSYSFFVNGILAQTGLSSIYTTDTLSDGDQVFVRGVSGTCSSGCEALSDTITVTVNPTPTLILDPNYQEVLIPTDPDVSLEDLILSATPTGGLGQFSGTGVGVDTSGSFIFSPSTFNPPDTVFVNYVYTSTAGCSTTESIRFIIADNSTSAIRDTITKQLVPNLSEFCMNDSIFYITFDTSAVSSGRFFCNIRCFSISDGVSLDTVPALNPLTEFPVGSGRYEFDPSKLTTPGSYRFDVMTSPDPSCPAPPLTSVDGFIEFTIKAVPATPVLIDPSTAYCDGSVADTLNISNVTSGVTYNWFSPVDTLINSNTLGYFLLNTDSVINSSNDTTFFVQTELNGCFSNAKDSSTLTICDIPGPPIPVTPPDYCAVDSVEPLVVIGEAFATFLWYNQETTLISSTPNPSFTIASSDLSIGNNTFYVSQIVSCDAGFSGCQSELAVINVFVKAPLSAPTVFTTIDTCQADTGSLELIKIVGETGASINWYTDAALTQIYSGTSAVNDTMFEITDTSINISTPTTRLFYVTQLLDGCESPSSIVSITINQTPEISIFGLESAYCAVPDVSDSLLGSPITSLNGQGGFYVRDLQGNANLNAISATGPGTGSVSLFPDQAGTGEFWVIYEYVNAASLGGCSAADSQKITIEASPIAGMTLNGNCVGDSLIAMDNTLFNPDTTNNFIVNWEWIFSDTIISGAPSVNFNQIQDPGLFDISLKVTGDNGCQDSVTNRVFIGSSPGLDFSWVNTCEGDITEFTGIFNLRGDEEISAYAWNFGEGWQNFTGPVVGGISITDTLVPGIQQVLFTIETTNIVGADTTIISAQCQDTVSHLVFGFPSTKVTADAAYLESFEADMGGWLEQASVEALTPDWQYGIPTGSVIDTSSTGPNFAWVTNLDTTYSSGENSWVNGPCFDLSDSTLTRPMLAMNIWSHSRAGRDGAVVQASKDGGDNWVTIGGFDDNNNSTGINWYNDPFILSQPGEQRIFGYGWTGLDSTWKNARHKLDAFIGEGSVRIRVAFASDSAHLQDPNAGDASLNGFAFDDFFIGNRSRVILLEHFTNINQTAGPVDNQFVYDLLSVPNNGLDVIPIQYHVSFPGSGDAIHGLNQDDPDARAFQYGVSEIGRSAINGNEYYNTSDLDQNIIDTRSLVDPGFTIDTLSMTIVNNTINVSTVVTSNKVQTTGEEVFVHIAIVEDSLVVAGDTLHGVLRKLVPDNAGQAFNGGQNWAQNTSDVITGSWTFSSSLISDTSNLEAVVFVQEKNTNQIYQAATTKAKPQAVNNIASPSVWQPEILVYPNPNTGLFNVIFDKAPRSDVNWELIDMRGGRLSKGLFKVGLKQHAIDTGILAEGIYYLKMSSDARPLEAVKVVIFRDR